MFTTCSSKILLNFSRRLWEVSARCCAAPGVSAEVDKAESFEAVSLSGACCSNNPHED